AVARAHVGERGVSKSVVLLTGDRGFESISLQRGVACEPEDDIDIPVRRGSTITIRSRSTTSRRDSRVAERLSRMPYRPRAGGFSGPRKVRAGVFRRTPGRPPGSPR